MTTAQPGQEQRMELKAGTYWTAHWTGSDEAEAWLHLGRGLVERGVLGYTREGDEHHVIAAAALSSTRPTADLGDDGELVEFLRFVATDVASHENDAAKLNEAADRLILYREALEGMVHIADFGAEDSKEYAFARAVLSRRCSTLHTQTGGGC